jgi:mannitol 2-dehydrogenase
MTPLRAATLHRHAGRGVAIPQYDRRALVPSVVHISVGSFHRSHQAVYFDDLAQRGETGWGLVGVGLNRPTMRDALVPQDGLYTVVARGAGGDAARIVGVIRRYVFAPEDARSVVTALADPRTRLVTLTITGGGYRPGQDRGAVRLLVDALERRRHAGLPPFTVLSCDNVPGNGGAAGAAVVGVAGERDPALAAWLEEQGAFPSSMVDRITPRTTPADRAFVAERFGIDDRSPVMTEPFSQWVVEDEFSAGRPPLDTVGVQFVRDVRPYVLTKTRLLNASHCALGHLGVLAGLRTTDQAMRDPLFGASVAAMMEREVSPLLPLVPGIDLRRYRATVRERLANPVIRDELARLCRNGSAKVPLHVGGSIADARRRGAPHALLTLAVAGWIRFLRGTDEAAAPVEVDDPFGARLGELARRGGTDPRPLLREPGLFGELAADAGFAAELEAALQALETRGVRGALADALAGDLPVAA